MVDPMISSAVGETPPDIYGAVASLAVLRVGLALPEIQTPDLLYLSTTDYMQQRYPSRHRRGGDGWPHVADIHPHPSRRRL